jgi:multiple sugar transport system substrate-binding protein
MSRNNVKITLLLIASLLILGLIGTACGGAAPPPEKIIETVVVEKEVEKIVEKEVTVVETVEVEKIVEVEKQAEAVAPVPYNLTPGKPYDGAKLRFLICCPTAGQFAQGMALTGEGSEFQDLTGITVEWDTGPFNAFQAKLLVETTSGTGDFDAVTWVDSWGHAIKPFLTPLNQYIERDGIDLADFPPVYIEAASDGEGKGIVYGLPYRGHALIMYYRKDIFDELRLEPPKTWQELVETGKIIEENYPDIEAVSMYYGVGGGQNVFLWLSHVWGNGSDIFDDTYHPIFNQEAGLEATQAYIDILRKDKLTSEGAITFNEGDAGTEMQQGRAAMFINWWWRWSTFQDPEANAPEILGNIAFAPAPGWEGKPSMTYGYIWPVGISQFSRNQEAAWEFIKYLTSPEIEKRVALDKSDPALTNNVVVHFSNLNDPEVNAAWDNLPQVGGEVLKTARTEPLVSTWSEVEATLEVGINEMATGADVKTTLDRMAADIEEVMERGGYYD